MSLPLPEGYEPHELPADYTGPLWIESQMQAYGQACRAAALEEAAEVCSNEQWRNEKNKIAYIKAFNEGCTDCEAAIRRLI